MPDTALTQAIKEAYAAAPSDVVILHTLELRHSAFVDQLGNPTSIRVVLDHVDLTAKLEADAPVDPSTFVTFVAYAFSLELPAVEKTGNPEVSVVIDDVSQEIKANIEVANAGTEKIELTYRPYLSTDLNGPQMNPPLHLVITNIKADLFKITARASFGDDENRQFPADNYTAERFPGLIR